MMLGMDRLDSGGGLGKALDKLIFFLAGIPRVDGQPLLKRPARQSINMVGVALRT